MKKQLLTLVFLIAAGFFTVGCSDNNEAEANCTNATAQYNAAKLIFDSRYNSYKAMINTATPAELAEANVKLLQAGEDMEAKLKAKQAACGV